MRAETESTYVHGTAVRFCDKGVLLIGPSQSGKSDLALRMIDAGALLIADDQVRLQKSGDRLQAEPHDRLAGLIELRGIGIMRVPFAPGPLDLAVDLLAPDAETDRLPKPATLSWLGVALPCIRLDARAPSAVARIRMVLHAERVH